MFSGTADGARSVLSTIAQSMLTFTGLVFTITMLVLQLASGQLSPRVMRTFLRDHGNQVVLGLFVATFVYTLLTLRDVRSAVDGDGGFVPAVSIWVAFTLLLASVAAFVYYIDHMAHAIRASTVITSIWQETVAAIDHLFPERLGDDAEPGAIAVDRDRDEPDGPDLVLTARRTGVVVGVDEDRLFRAASHGDRRLELVPAIGDFVAENAPLIRLWGSWDAPATEALLASIGLADERTLDQDAAFGFRQLVDIAVRALSPGINDPTTAVQALDRIHDLLRRLVTCQFPSRFRADDRGLVRVVVQRPGWDAYVHLGLDEIRLAGEGQLQVHRRLRAILADLGSIAPDDRQAVLRDERARIDAAAERACAEYPRSRGCDRAGRSVEPARESRAGPTPSAAEHLAAVGGRRSAPEIMSLRASAAPRSGWPWLIGSPSSRMPITPDSGSTGTQLRSGARRRPRRVRSGRTA